MTLKGFIAGFYLFFFTSASFAAGPVVLETIPGNGFGTAALALDEDKNLIFALDTRLSTIYIIDGNKNSLRSRITLSQIKGNVNMGSDGMAYDPQTGRLFFPGGESSIYVVDIKRRKIVKEIVSKRGGAGWTPSVQFDRVKGELIVLDGTGFIQRYDTDGNLLREHQTGVKDMKHYTLSPDGRFIYVVTNNGVERIDLKKNKVDDKYYFDGGKIILGIPLIDEKKDQIYIGGPRLVHRLGKRKGDDGSRNVTNMTELNYIPLSGSGMGLNPNTRHIFVPLSEDRLAVLNADTNKIVKVLKVGRGPRSIVVNKKNNRVYVASVYDGHVTVIEDR